MYQYRNLLFYNAQKPPMCKHSDDSLNQKRFAATDEDKAHVRRTAHGSLRIVEEAENAGVVQFMRVVLNEEVSYERARTCVNVETKPARQVETNHRTSRKDREPRRSTERPRCAAQPVAVIVLYVIR